MKYNFKIVLIMMISFQWNEIESMVTSYNKSDDHVSASNEYEDMYASISPTKPEHIAKKSNGNFYENVVDALDHYFTTPINEIENKIDTTPEVTSFIGSQDTKNSVYDYLFEDEEKKEKTTDTLTQLTEQSVHPILLSAINSPDKGMQAAINFVLSESNVNNQNNPTETSPLHFAIKYNAYNLAALLIGAGANVNAQDIDGYTPLHSAVIYHHNEDTTNDSIKALLKAGANLYIQDKEGKTAAKIARELNMMPLYDLIEQAAVYRLIN
ncbi:ankyrin repeat domain-containing protein [Candidatus Chromulinivorax destructor]|uniref:Uncharacterized protein n=1 Tax=Candidatus Chromulinivorax destructor TaxID=2066483 RepID=A0A345ZBG7_9BACT|nr:ankyrin repeat domain-containing protein [Candidatus Chromulinivorax destructor]AXK60634.1 hypothetical protein C0J27_02655 [Candidatus Chromulinivorax destructor]